MAVTSSCPRQWSRAEGWPSRMPAARGRKSRPDRLTGNLERAARAPPGLSAAHDPTHHRAGILGRGVAGPGDVTVGTHEHKARGVGGAPVAIAVADDFQ